MNGFRLRVLVLFAVLTSAASAANWPLTGSLGAHDPTIIKDGNTWWCFATGAGVPIKSSPDGLNWIQGGRLFDAELPWWRTYAPTMGNVDVWAPDLHKFANRIWCYYCVSEFGRNNSAIGLKSCTTLAAGDWRDDGLVIASSSGRDLYNAIDPTLTVDADGNPWLAFGSWFDGIHLVRLDPATMKPTGQIFGLARRNNGIEAANIVYVNGYYYLFVSIDVCCQGVNSTYKIAYGRATSITGPYADKNGVAMLNGGVTVLDVGDARWIGPGGQDVYQNGNAWVIARHAYDATRNGAPTLLISDLFWDESNWPTYTAPALPAAPALIQQPVSVTVAPGGPVNLTVSANGDSLSYQWKKDGNNIAGATSANFSIAAAGTADSGSYTVAVTNAGGTVTSDPATVLIDVPRPGRLINLSVRTRAGSGDQTLIVGFVVSGAGTKPIMVRATGPTLARFGVTGVLPDPLLELYRDQTLIATNDSWGSAANQSAILAAGGDKLGAVALTNNEAVLLQSFTPRAYTAQVKDAASGQGIALVEVFDTDAAQPGTPEFAAQPKLLNVSARAQVGTGENVLIAGFVINGNVPRRLLLRGVGPTLSQLGVSGALPDPQVKLFDSAGKMIATNDDWAAAPNQAAILAAGGTQLGALTLDAKDAVLLVTVTPAAYTVQISGVNNTIGNALIEIYDLP